MKTRLKPATKRTVKSAVSEPHIPPCSDRFAQRVFAPDMDYTERFLCRCCGKLMPGKRNPLFGAIADPLCKRCERLQETTQLTDGNRAKEVTE